MDLLVVGGGGREHAVIKALRKNPEVKTIYCLPGNAGIAQDATCVPIGAKDLRRIADFAVEKKVDFAVVTPDDPLVLGAVDLLEKAGIPCFGPRRNAAIIEGSKVFSKHLMQTYGIPTANFETFDSREKAYAYVASCPLPCVIKADGLALGKGVLIARTREEARDAVRTIMENRKFGDSGKRVVIEEFLEGPEVSVLSFTDGTTVVPMVSSMDHKRALDGDQGLNTGGMGTIAPNPYYTPEIADECMRTIFLPTIRAMKKEGREFRGCLYFGLMLTAEGPRVIEYNCRFGDPEAQVVLPLLESDLLTILQACRDGTLADTEVRFSSRSACCVILASRGYPASYEKGFPIQIDSSLSASVLYAGVASGADGSLVTNGGRVLGVVETADTLPEAIRKAYSQAEKIHFSNAYCRKDIGARALKALQK